MINEWKLAPKIAAPIAKATLNQDASYSGFVGSRQVMFSVATTIPITIRNHRIRQWRSTAPRKVFRVFITCYLVGAPHLAAFSAKLSRILSQVSFRFFIHIRCNAAWRLGLIGLKVVTDCVARTVRITLFYIYLSLSNISILFIFLILAHLTVFNNNLPHLIIPNHYLLI